MQDLYQLLEQRRSPGWWYTLNGREKNRVRSRKFDDRGFASWEDNENYYDEKTSYKRRHA